MLTAVDVKDPQSPERSQLVFGIVEAFRNLEGPCPGRAHVGKGASGIYQRRTQRGVELHLSARVPARSGPESGERPLDAAAALVDQRQMHPQRQCGGCQRHADRCITVR
jgi:hypothetical protein